MQTKASVWAFICGVLQRGIQFLVTPIFTRLLNTTEYGEFTAFQSWLDVLGIFLTLRLFYGVFTQGLIRYAGDREDNYTAHLIGLMSVIELAAFLVYLPNAETIDSMTGLTHIQAVSIFLLTWTSGVFEFWRVRQRVEFKYRALVAVTLVFAATQPIAGILAVLSFSYAPVDARVVSMVIVQIILFGWIALYYGIRGRSYYDCFDWSHALKIAVPLIPHYLSGSLLSTSDRIMVKTLASSSAAGIYGLAYSMSFLMSIVSQSINSTLEPWIYQRIRDGDVYKIARVAYLAFIGVCSANLLTIAIAPEALALLAPPEYSEGVYLVPPLAASVVVSFLYMLFAEFEFYYEHTAMITFASIIGAFLNLILNWLFIPMLGYQVAAWTTLIGYLVYVYVHYCFMCRIQKSEMSGVLVYDIRIIVGILGVFALFSAMLTTLFPFPLARWGLCIIIVISAIKQSKKIMTIWHRFIRT